MTVNDKKLPIWKFYFSIKGKYVRSTAYTYEKKFLLLIPA